MCDSQMNLAISYYNLYTNISAEEEAPRPSAEEAPINSKAYASNERVLIIQDDVWTAQDEEEAAALLERSLDRCRITHPARTRQNVQAPPSSSSLPSSDRGLIPDDTIAWDQFYRQHQTNFFKDRHYLQKTFPNEFGNSVDINSQPPPQTTAPQRTLVEIGCGVGNALLPILEDDHQSRSWTVHGIDLSSVAIDLMCKDSRFQEAAQDGRAFGWTANLVQGLPAECQGVATVSTLLFCLSAIDPTQHVAAARHAAATLQEGGVLIIRDYARYDEAQLKLAAQRHKLWSNNFYVKYDSTKCYYFTTDDLHKLFVQDCGLVALDNECIRKVYTNRHTGVSRRRAWVQARFQKKTAAPNSY